jgi:N utilization substance protein A
MGVDKDLALKLIENDFETVLKISQAEPSDLEKIENIDIEISETLIERAEEALLEIALADIEDESEGIKSDVALETIKSLNKEFIELLSAADIKNKDDLADLASDELAPILNIDEEEAGKIIMEARADWF